MSSTLVDRVREVVAAAGVSQRDFAQLIGIAPDKLSKSLNGARRFTSLELALIAEAGSTTVDWLLTGRSPSPPRLAARTNDPTTQDRDGIEIEQLARRYSSAHQALTLLQRPPDLPPLPEVPGSGRYIDQGAALARAALGRLSDAGVDPTTDDLASAWEQVFGVDVAVTDLPDGLDGLAWQTDTFRLVLVKRSDRWTRQRFTLAHELGHIVSRDAQELVADGAMAPGLNSDPAEVRANAFAANLLMPEEMLRDAGQVSREAFVDLVVQLRVSPSALAARLSALRLIDASRRAEWSRLTTAECFALVGDEQGYLARAGAANAERPPNRLLSELFAAFRAGQTTLRPMAALLQRDVGDLHALLVSGPLPPESEPDAGDPVFAP